MNIDSHGGGGAAAPRLLQHSGHEDMRVVLDGQLWVGRSRDLGDVAALPEPEGLAIVDLAIDEPIRPVFREQVSLRIPLLDGAENSPARMKFAVDSVASLLRAQQPTLIVCSNGMSRSPAVAAAAIAVVHQVSLENSLSTVSRAAACDISPALWNDLHRMFAGQTAGTPQSVSGEQSADPTAGHD